MSVLLLTVKYFVHTNATLACYGVSITQLAKSQDCSLNQVVSIGRALRLCNHILDTYTLQYSTHSTTSLKTSTGSSGLKKNFGTTESHFNLVRNGTLQYRNLNKVLLGSLSTLGNCSGNLTSLTKAPTDNTIAITYNDDSSECKGATTFGNLGYSIDSNQAVFQFNVTIYSYFIHCHNRLKFKTTFACCISQSLYTSVIEITITVENNTLNTGFLGILGYESTNLLGLLNLGHLFETERRS